MVEQELLGLVGEDGKRFPGVDHVDPARSDLTAVRGPPIFGDRALDGNRALDLDVLRRRERGIAESVTAARDLDDPGPVPQDEEQDSPRGTGPQHPAAEPDRLAERVGGECPGDRVEGGSAHEVLPPLVAALRALEDPRFGLVRAAGLTQHPVPLHRSRIWDTSPRSSGG